MPEFIELDASALAERPMLNNKQAGHTILLYWGWDAYERAHRGPDIIDFDLSSIQGSASFNSRRDVLSAMLELYHQLNDVGEEGGLLRTRVPREKRHR